MAVKKSLLGMLILSVLLLYSATAEDGAGRITIVQSLPEPAAEETESYAFKPEALGEADRAVIGTDNRITIQNPAEYPFSAIAYLDISYGCRHEGAFGTGFMVGEDWLITAGHCFFCPLCHEAAKQFTLFFGYVNERNYLACSQDTDWNAWIVSDAVQRGSEYYKHDYGILHLSIPIGQTTGWFGLRYRVPDEELSRDRYHVTGYRNGILRHDADRVEPIDELYLKHYADTELQNSGCPVYDDAYDVIAINSAEKKDGSENYAVRITDEIFKLMTENGFKPTDP